METVGLIDWLSVTFPADLDERLLEVYFGAFKTLGAGSHGYARRAQSQIGAVLLADGETRQGKALTLSGTTLDALRVITQSDGPLLDFVGAHSGRASRVDLTLDVLHSRETVARLWTDLENGLVRTHATKNEAYTSVETGVHGFYIGSRKSDKFLRVYDKALEQGVDSLAWLRLELECHRLVARSYVDSMIKQKKVRPFINKAIAEFADFPASVVLREALAQDDADLPKLTAKTPQFWRWMETQVIPAMAARQASFPEENVLYTLTLLYNKALERRGRGSGPSDPLLAPSE